MTALAQALPMETVLAAQSAFRAIMFMMARPGTVHTLAKADAAPLPLSPTAANVARTLFDHDTLVWLDAPLAANPEVAQWLQFHTGARITAAAEEAHFALIADPGQMLPFGAFHVGTPEYPDRSTTIILQVKSLTAGTRLVLAGPGIRDSQRFGASPVPADLVSRLAINRGLFPRGVDLLLVGDGAAAALPRSVRVSERG